MKNSIKWYIRLNFSKKAQFWQFHPLMVHGSCRKWPNFDLMILLRYFKELTLSFQKNIKFLKSDTPNKSYGCSKIPSTCDIYYKCVLCMTISYCIQVLYVYTQYETLWKDIETVYVYVCRCSRVWIYLLPVQLHQKVKRCHNITYVCVCGGGGNSKIN